MTVAAAEDGERGADVRRTTFDENLFIGPAAPREEIYYGGSERDLGCYLLKQ